MLPPDGRALLELGECHNAVPNAEDTTFKSFAHLTCGFTFRCISLHFPLQALFLGAEGTALTVLCFQWNALPLSLSLGQTTYISGIS